LLFLLGATPPEPPFRALDMLEDGQWELRSREAGEPPIRLCLGDARLLLQPRHGSRSCDRFVVSNEPAHVTITYTCASAGHGRTDLRVETPRLVQIDSQGVAAGLPFAMALEGRRIGACSPLAAR
jgi:hypothetical protein